VILRETYQVDSLENYAMTAKPSIDPARMLHDQLASASPGLLRSLLAAFLDSLMPAEADAICGAP
jgi:putative transposase